MNFASVPSSWSLVFCTLDYISNSVKDMKCLDSIRCSRSSARLQSIRNMR